MAENKRTIQKRLNDLVKISKLYLQGKTQLEISKIIGVSRVQICYDIKQVFLEWKQERIEFFEEKILLELEKINLLESEAWNGWHSSVKIKKPDRSFFQDIKWAIETRLRILSVLPKKFSEEKKEDINDSDIELIEAEIDETNSNGR